MKIARLLFITAMLATISPQAHAQTTVQIGTGNASSTSKGPWYQLQSNNKSKKVMLFTEEELNAQGIYPGIIMHAMKWYKTSNDSFVNGAAATATLYIRNAGSTYPINGYGSNSYNVLDHIDSGFVQVSTVNYNSNGSNIGTNDWVGFTDFYYTYMGGDLEVYIDWQAAPGYCMPTTTGNFQWQYTATGSANRYMYYHGVPYNSSNFTNANERPNTLIVFTEPLCSTAPIAGVAVSDAQGPICQGTSFGLTLNGNSTSTSQSYTWQTAPSATGPWTNFSVPLQQSLIGIGAPAHTTWYRAAVSCGSFVAYSAPVEVQVLPGLGWGTYTINSSQPTGGTNFNSFTDAMAGLSCGITGPVVFEVAAGSGPYYEQIVIPQLGGTSLTNTVIINGNGATISHTSANSDERAVIKLDGADFVIINDLNIEVHGFIGQEYGFGIQLMNNADYNIINECKIHINTTTSSATSGEYAGIVINGHDHDPLVSNAGRCDYNIIRNNIVTGGYFGIVVTGEGETVTLSGNLISGNTIRDFYAYGIYAANNTTAIIEGNNISRPNRAGVADFAGIQLKGYNASLMVLGNRIHDPFGGNESSTDNATGISIINCNPPEGSDNVIANNLLYNFKNAGSQHGFLINNASHVKFQHNTVALEHANATCNECGVYGLYQHGAEARTVDFSNNIISIDGANAGTIRALHFDHVLNGTTFNNNNYYFGSGVKDDAEFGSINGQAYQSLLLWKVGVLGDLFSVSKSPGYQDVTSNNYRPTTNAIDNMGMPTGILLDIEGNLRNIVTPDIGAYEFEAYPTGVASTTLSQDGINIYPNPANEQVNIVANETVTVTICSMDGKILIEKKDPMPIDIKELTPGVYIIKVVNADGVLLRTEKLLKAVK